jgi:hypothetical protein
MCVGFSRAGAARHAGANACFWENLRFDCSEAAGDDRLQWVAVPQVPRSNLVETS